MLSASSTPLCPPRRAVRACTAAFAASVALTAANAGPATTADADPAREFVVYLGLDLTAEVNGRPCPVVGGNARQLEVLDKDGVIHLPISGGNYKTAMEPKMSHSRAQIDDLRGERAYSPATDPHRQAMEQQMVMESVQAHAQDVAHYEANKAAREAEATARDAANPMSGVTSTDVARAQQKAYEAAQRFSDSYSAPAFRSALPGDVDDNETYDAFEVSFRLSLPEARERALGVLRLVVRDPANPKEPAQTIKFFELKDLGPKPRKFRWSQMGLPAGFAVDSYSVHVYVDGAELPTNLSQNRVDITVDEAHQFLILRHMHANRHASLPAQVAADLRPARLAALVPAERRQATVELAINHEGRITKLRPSAAFPDAVTPELETALLDVRFLPALLNGQAVASHGTFALGEFLP